MKRHALFLAACLLLMITGAAAAQGAPQQINDAFADLNRRLGTNYSTANTRWTWSEELWFNRALGCSRLETADLAYEEIRGFRVRIDLDLTGAESWDYDYRISYEPDILILCSPDLDSAPTPTPTSISTSTPPPPPTTVPGTAAPASQPTPTICDPSVPPRLRIGEPARVTPGIPNNVRSGAGSSNQYLGEIPAEAQFTVLAGPLCAGGLAWWQVSYNGLIGWTAEGQEGEYWLEPELGSLEPITPENATQLGVLAELPRPDIATAHLQFEGSSLYVNSVGGITAYRLADRFAAADALRWQAEVVARLDASQDARILDFVVLDATRAIAVYARNDFSQMWTALLPGLTDPRELGAIAPGIVRISPDGRYAARVETASGNGQTLFVYDLTSGQSWAIENAPHSAPVQAMSFSPDGRLLITGDTALLVVWEVFAWDPTVTDANDVILGAQVYPARDVTYVNQMSFLPESQEFLVSTSDVALNSLVSWHGIASRSVQSTETATIVWKDVLPLGSESALLGGAYGGDGSLALLDSAEVFPLAIAGVEALTAVRDMALSADGRLLAIQTDTRVLILGVAAQPTTTP